jgi:hypothetical protein
VTALLHLVLGTLGALAILVALARISGEPYGSAAFGAVVVGIACAALAAFLSPWATPAVLVLYALAGAFELRRGR